VSRILSTALVLALAAAACSGGQRAETRARLSTREILDRNKPSIVRIEVESPRGTGVGTGFVVGKDGRIATNFHVIAGQTNVNVRLLDGRLFPVERVLAADTERDLAIVRINLEDLPTVKLGNSDDVSAGDRVVAIGNPLGVLDYTVSDGLISSIRPLDAKRTLLQISAPISQGSSGGPLYNLYGEVIGVAVGISSEGQNLNFGIPVNDLRPLLSAKGEGDTLVEFAARTEARLGARSETPTGRDLPKDFVRKVPKHPLRLLNGCTPEQILSTAKAISEAIQIGAPVYNLGQYEACFVIYRKTAETYQRDSSMCKGIRDAFTEGLSRADKLEEHFAKAWALRDTFDGLLDVFQRAIEAPRVN
jgi:hypothetical protein